MTRGPTQFDVKLTASSSKRYEGTHGPEKAKQSGEFEENTKGMRKIKLILDFPEVPVLSQPRWL